MPGAKRTDRPLGPGASREYAVGMRSSLVAVSALAAVLAAAPLVRGEDAAYTSLVGLAQAPAQDPAEEARLPAAAPREPEADVKAPPRREPSAWTKLFILLLPPKTDGLAIPELRASTAAFAGPRPIRYAPPLRLPRQAEEGTRRGLADVMALMSAGTEPLPVGRR